MCLPRAITATRALRGSPSSRTAAPAIASEPLTSNSIRSSGPASSTDRGLGITGAGVSMSRRRAATHSSVVPCTRAETRTTKKTALKIVSPWSTCSERTKVPRTMGTAPRRPAQPRNVRSLAVKSLNAVEANTASGRTTTTRSSARTKPDTITSGRSLGNTSSPSTTNIVTCARNASASWNATRWPRCREGVLPTARPTR